MILKNKNKFTNLKPSGPCSHGNWAIISKLQPSGSCSHGTQKQEQLIINQVAPARKVIKQISKLRPCGSCSHGTRKQEQIIYNQVAPAHMVIDNNK